MSTNRPPDHHLEQLLNHYGDLAISGALNLQPGQRLLVLGPIASGGVSLHAAPLIRAVTASAYRAGARLVEVLWGDEDVQVARFTHAPRDSFEEFSRWMPRTLAEHAEAGDAVLSVYANDPDLLEHQDPALVGALQGATAAQVRGFRELISRNATNWAVVAAAHPRWAAKVFPGRPPAEQLSRLWDEIARLCRLTHAHPLEAWDQHLARLAARRDFLNRKRYRALRFTAPGTDLTVGLPEGHTWVSGRSVSERGVAFAPNLPTEEVFTIADRERVSGVVTASKPLSYGGTMIEAFRLEFAGGRAVAAQAGRGQDVLSRLLATDPGAACLGEVALVPHGSPVAQSGLLFFNTLFDENAANHVALGSAYRFTLEGGEMMDNETFERAGGNRSAIHVDFMIGSAAMDVDGLWADGSPDALMRRGEWVE